MPKLKHMPPKDGRIEVRIEEKLKKDAEKILSTLGLSLTDSITLFYKQICLNNGLPFPVKIPNALTKKILKESNAGENIIKCQSKDDLFRQLNL